MAVMTEPYTLRLITGPDTEPINLATDSYAQDYLTLSGTTDPRYEMCRNYLMPAARRLAESYSNRAFFTQTWEMSFDCQPPLINIPKGYLDSITSIKTIANDGTETTEDTDYYKYSTGDNGLVYLLSGYIWTSTTRPYDNFKVRFVAGWDDIDDIPQDIKTAILQITGFLLDNRESLPTIGDTSAGFTAVIPTGAKMLLDSYRLYNV